MMVLARWIFGTYCLRAAPCGAVRLPGCCSVRALVPFAPWAFGAAADRRIRTPTSSDQASAAQLVHQPEEDRQVRVPRPQPVHPAPPRAYDLAGQAHQGVHEGLELQPQHPALLRPVLLLPEAPGLPATAAPTTPSSPRPGPSSPGTPSCWSSCPAVPARRARRCPTGPTGSPGDSGRGPRRRSRPPRPPTRW